MPAAATTTRAQVWLRRLAKLTGTGFVTGNKLDLNGIVSQTEATYESTGAVSVTVPTP